MIVLASKSVTRAALLAGAGIAFRAVAAEVDERAIEAEAGAASPAETALLLAAAKALSVSAKEPEALVLGCDQILAFEGGVLHKSASRAELAEKLAALSGREHVLHSALVLARAGAELWRHVESVSIVFAELGAEAIEAYCGAETDAKIASVGGYRFEDARAGIFAAVRGSYSGILGLPLLPLLARLAAADGTASEGGSRPAGCR